jgi:hypothetical protein
VGAALDGGGDRRRHGSWYVLVASASLGFWGKGKVGDVEREAWKGRVKEEQFGRWGFPRFRAWWRGYEQ